MKSSPQASSGSKDLATSQLANTAKVAASGESPFTISIRVVTDTDTHRYRRAAAENATPDQFDSTVAQAISALRDDVLRGGIPKGAKTTFETTSGKSKPRVRAGTLIECASRYPALADLYTPVSRHARSGMWYGIFVGALLYLVFLGLFEYRTNQTTGTIILAEVIALVVIWLKFQLKINIPNMMLMLSMFATAFVVPIYLGAKGYFEPLVAAFSGGLLLSMPGMTVGAIVGTLRRPRLPRAYDAPPENATLRIAIPFVISIALWAAYLFLVRSYLLPMLTSETAINVPQSENIFQAVQLMS